MRGLLSIIAMAVVVALTAADARADDDDGREVAADEAALALRVNGALRPETVIVLRRDGRSLVAVESLSGLGLQGPVLQQIEIEGRRYVVLDSVAGLVHRVDDARQELVLDIDAAAMQGSRYDLSSVTVPRPRTPDWGGFLNYSLFGFADDGRDAESSTSTASGAAEAVLFGPHGSGTLSAIANPSIAGADDTQRLVRLDTNWRLDDIDSMRTLVVGDAISAPGAWGRPLRYAGLQYASNFSLQPIFITYPLQAIGGLASLPSTVDIYANNVRLASQPVQPGPFAINNMPMISGAGEMSVVVRNAFGQEQVISQPFYIARDLLAPGLSQFSLDVGSPRFNYGIRSADYRGWFASYFYREGISDVLTLEGRAEGDDRVRGGGLTADGLLGQLGVLTAGAATSIGERGTGVRMTLGFSRQAQWLSFALRSVWSTRDAQEVGEFAEFAEFDGALQRREVFANLNMSLGDGGSVSLTGLHRAYWGDTQGFDVGTISYSRSAGPLGFFTLALSRAIGVPNQTQVYAGFSFPIGTASGAISYQGTRSGGTTNGYGVASVQQSPPVGEGVGYRALAQTDERAEVGIEYAGRIGRYTVEAARSGDVNAVRGSVSGGIAWLGGYGFLARPITESFAVVRVGGISGVEVLQDNVVVGRTDDDGQIVISRIPAYNASKISIDPLSVPIDAAISKRQEWVNAYRRTGVLIDFPLRRERNLLLRLVDGDGQPLPVGSTVEVDGREQRYSVGFDGEVFVNDLQGRHRLRVRALKTRCEVVVELGAESPALTELGPYICQEGGR